MRRYLNNTEAKEYNDLASKAKAIESALSSLLVDVVTSDIPDDAKCEALDFLKRAETFQGLAYFLTPQTEWMGGDSSDPRNFKTRAPHIEGT